MPQSTTHSELRLLLVEDSADDAELLLLALSLGGYHVVVERVETGDEMRRALATGSWDLVISDYSLPAFSGPEALDVLKSAGLDLPFIIVSGTIGEETAVTALKAGAHDFLVKGRLARLIPAIERELRDVAQRRERAQAQQALLESEAKHRSLIERAVFGIYQATREGRFLTVNPALVSMLGYGSATDLTALSLAEVHTDSDACREFVDRLCEQRQLSGFDAMWLRKSGEAIRVRLSGRAIALPEVQGIVLEVIVEDTTERYRLEDQLRQAQKMEAIGHLAGGIAHDFNNLLTAILGYGALVQEAVQDRPEVAAEVGEIVRAGQRARQLTSQLLAFSRKEVIAPRLLDLDDVLRDAEGLLLQVVGTLVRVEISPDGHLPAIKVDAGQIEQVLVNLAVNARDAMPNGGTLTITTARAALPTELRLGDPSPPGDFVVLRVTDSGLGMANDVRSKIFEPFFTTKTEGQGTGLGLSTVYGIVTQAGGRIAVDSAVGKGTTFTIYLPAAADGTPLAAGIAPPPEATGPTERTAGVAGAGTETILLVEDEPAIRTLAERVLRRNGYRVLIGTDAPSGQRASQEHTGPIDLLVTDIRMPGMNGPELAQRVVFERPNIKVLYISGYANDAMRAQALRGRIGILQKPFSPQQFAIKIRECLDAAS